MELTSRPGLLGIEVATWIDVATWAAVWEVATWERCHDIGLVATWLEAGQEKTMSRHPLVSRPRLASVRSQPGLVSRHGHCSGHYLGTVHGHCS